MALPPLLPVAAVSSGLFGASVVAPPGLLIAAFSVLAALLLVVTIWAIAGLVRGAQRSPQASAPQLRLLLTANAWGYSERATLDESAVGL